MLFSRVTSRALVLWLLVLSWVLIPLVSPSATLATAPADGEYDPWGNTTGLQESYQNVILEGCTTPSLECLVYHIYQFISVEMSKNVVTINWNFAQADSEEGGSLPSYRSVAMGGAVGGLTTMMNGMYQRPIASSTTYIADLLESANVVTPAYAQGLGFAALDPILDLWKTFRNVAYIFFVIIFVVIGFMIMFRQKMGQTAVTAQQAIPKIIIALILVTFSYAIAGFAIDLMYLTMTLIIGVFYNVFPSGDQVLGYNIIELISTLVGAVKDFGQNIDLVSNIVGGMGAGPTAEKVVGAIGGTMLTVILSIAILIGTVRLFFELLRCYATVVLSVVISPLLLMMEAIPGKNAFKTWIKTLVGHLSPFPVVLLVLVMFYAFTDNAVRPTGGFMPPFLLGGGQAGNITSVMGLAIILAMPDIVQSIRKTIAPTDSFASMIVKSGTDNFKAGWTGNKYTGNIGARDTFTAPLAPLGVFASIGPQTRLERALVGSREYRKRERELAIQSGGSYKGKPYGGLVGAIQQRAGVSTESTNMLRRMLGTRSRRGVGSGHYADTGTMADLDPEFVYTAPRSRRRSRRRGSSRTSPPPSGTSTGGLSAAEIDEIVD